MALWYPDQNDHDGAWGTDVRALETAVGSALATTIASHPNAAGVTQITADPYTTRTTQGDNRADFGWAIDVTGASGMNSTADDRRIIPAGTWTLTMRIRNPGSNGTGSSSALLRAAVYRVASDGTRTQLFAFNDTNAINSSLGAAATGTVTISSSQPAFTIFSSQTIHLGIIVVFSQTAGVVGGTIAGPVTLYTGPEGGVNGNISIPDFRYNYLRDFTLDGRGTSSRVIAPAMTRSLIGKGDTTYTKATVVAKTFSLDGRGTVSRQFAVAEDFDLIGKGTTSYTRATVVSRTYTLDGRGTVTRNVANAISRTLQGKGTVSYNRQALIAKIFTLDGRGTSTYTKTTQAQRTFSLEGKGTVSRQFAVAEDFDLSGRGNVSYTKAVLAARTFTLQGSGTVSRTLAITETKTLIGKGLVTELHPLTANRTFTVQGRGRILMSGPNGSSITVPLDELPTGEGGGETIINVIKKPIYIFDD